MYYNNDKTHDIKISDFSYLIELNRFQVEAARSDHLQESISAARFRHVLGAEDALSLRQFVGFDSVLWYGGR